jgi:hypothetical protein
VTSGEVPAGRAKRISYFDSFFQNLSVHSFKVCSFREKSIF